MSRWLREQHLVHGPSGALAAASGTAASRASSDKVRCVTFHGCQRSSLEAFGINMQVSPARREDCTSCDVLLVGGGLANSLVALELRTRHPQLRVIMLERAEKTVANHTWCVFRFDLSNRGWKTLSGIFANTWSSYEVAFPEHRRRIDTTYARLTEEDLVAAVEGANGIKPYSRRQCPRDHAL